MPRPNFELFDDYCKLNIYVQSVLMQRGLLVIVLAIVWDASVVVQVDASIAALCAMLVLLTALWQKNKIAAPASNFLAAGYGSL